MVVLALLLLAIAKLLATNICLATGWKGGRIFLLMFKEYLLDQYKFLNQPLRLERKV